MDLGITWVGNIYEKFETMCLQVDEMQQDAVDLIENHVQTVGASVKKFYSDVVQELVTPSSDDSDPSSIDSDPSSVDSDTSSVDSGKKYVSGIELEESMDAEMVKKSRVGRKIVRRKKVAVRPRKVKVVLPMATTRTYVNQRFISDGNFVKENQTSEISELSPRELRMDDDVQVTEDDTIRRSVENEKSCEEEVIADSLEVSLQGEETTLPQSTTEKLEESCIFIDEDELHFVVHKEGKHKKTLGEALSLRKMSSRAQEYKQLAAKYADETQPSKERSGTASRLEEGSESDWELL